MAKKAPRDPKDIMAEYGRTCADLGNAVYNRDVALPRLMDELKGKLLKLNEEHAAAVAAKETVSNG